MENSGFDIIKKFFRLNIPCIAYSSHDSGGFVEHATSPAVGAKGFVSKNGDGLQSQQYHQPLLHHR
nr:hypothetical protein [uncultured Treponema sp.]